MRAWDPRDSCPPRVPAAVSACRGLLLVPQRPQLSFGLSRWIRFLSRTVCSLLFLAFSTDKNHLVHNPWWPEAGAAGHSCQESLRTPCSEKGAPGGIWGRPPAVWQPQAAMVGTPRGHQDGAEQREERSLP